MLVQIVVHLRTPRYMRIWLFFLVWPEIFTKSTPTKPHTHGMCNIVNLVEDIRAWFYFYSSSEMFPSVSNIGRVRFHLVPLFEGLCPLPCKRCPYSCPDELHEVVCRVVVCAGHHQWPEPSFCEFTIGPVLMVKTNT